MKNQPNITKLSKFLSLILRHKPETIGIELDAQGWTPVSTLIERMKADGKQIDLEALKIVVESNNKKRFAFSEDGNHIRANQGHSLMVDLGLVPRKPPVLLFHGTAERNLKSIFELGLLKRDRHHVHLSQDKSTALDVGQRYGKPVILKVDAEQMYQDGMLFFESDNGVWLTDYVPVKYLSRL